jgi:hypothetical protein
MSETPRRFSQIFHFFHFFEQKKRTSLSLIFL